MVKHKDTKAQRSRRTQHLPGANVVAAFLVATTIVRDPYGQRLGDRFALTQVVEGFGAREIVAAVQELWLDLVEHLDQPRKPRRVPPRPPLQFGFRED